MAIKKVSDIQEDYGETVSRFEKFLELVIAIILIIAILRLLP